MRSLRLPLIVLSLLCLIFLLLALQQFFGREQEKRNRVMTEKLLDETKQVKEKIQQELDNQTKLKETLESQLSDVNLKFSTLQDEAENLSLQIAEEKKAKEEALSKLEDRSRELEALKSDFESEKKEHLGVQEQYDKVNKEYESLKEELKTLKSDNEQLLKQIQQSTSQEMTTDKEVQLDKIVVKSGVEAEGKVLVVNKEFNFIVVSSGNNKGVTRGFVFGIFRNGDLIGKAQVEKVYETMSAANIMPDSKDIREGDLAKALPSK
ncbi:MAG: hypothetical protein V1933_03910 [Candidatus Omnitrophota bacterium]